MRESDLNSNQSFADKRKDDKTEQSDGTITNSGPDKLITIPE